MSIKLYESEKEFSESVTYSTMNDAYLRIKRLGKAFPKVDVNSTFTKNDRVKMLMRMVSFFEQNEEYEKCSFLMSILKMFGITNFCTAKYYL